MPKCSKPQNFACTAKPDCISSRNSRAPSCVHFSAQCFHIRKIRHTPASPAPFRPKQQLCSDRWKPRITVGWILYELPSRMGDTVCLNSSLPHWPTGAPLVLEPWYAYWYRMQYIYQYGAWPVSGLRSLRRQVYKYTLSNFTGEGLREDGVLAAVPVESVYIFSIPSGACIYLPPVPRSLLLLWDGD